ncbi:hypothetical protein HNO88_000213 [Novosphingobium chloroacetimidivorans]|uniref:Mlr4354 like protein n=1 Tax=Novosphingobium chloroacetimidivorans TaxID=1428314 RepID=A0A7W7K679_9SPHN|nr:hypothetical protein [Novosphingobium chloroacetimidivorans]MBB4856916.1 hypothetical protein [Novosphingobium chloroacetimidivorans]
MPHRSTALPRLIVTLLVVTAGATPLAARDSLGLYASWGAFRDPVSPRCYAIAMAEPSAMRRDYQPYAAIGTWPRRGVRNQVHFRVSRRLAPGRPIVLTVGDRRFQLIGGGGDAWAVNNGDNAAIVAAMRSASTMRVSARDAQGRSFGNSWALAGAASAMDAASIGCARLD